MKKTPLNALRDLLTGKTTQLADESLKSKGSVNSEELKEVENLSRLIKVYEAQHPPEPPKRWPVALVLVGTLAVLSFLLFARVPETEIELDIQLTEAGFTLTQRQMLTNAWEIETLGLSGLREAQVPRSSQLPRQNFEADQNSGLSLLLANGAKTQGSLTLSAITLLPGTAVTVQPKKANQYRLSFKGTPLNLQASVFGNIDLSVAGDTAQALEFTSPRPVDMLADSQQVDLDITEPEQSTYQPFSSQIQVQKLSFSRIFYYADEQSSIVKRLSTILSGKLYFESLKGQERLLRPSEDLRFAFSEGEIRSLRWQDDQLHLQFHGTVKGMTVGADETQRSLMPTYLEWLSARHGLSLLWGSTLYMFGIIMGILRWWGKLN